MVGATDRSRAARLWRRVAPLVVVATLAAAPVASAEEATYAPNAVREVPAMPTKPGDVTTNQVAADGVMQCSVPWANVQAGVSSFVIGGCRSGTQWTRTSSADNQGSYYSAGYIPGNFSGCGWLETAQYSRVTSGTSGACGYPAPSKVLTDYAATYNNSGIAYDSAGNPIGNDCKRSLDKTKCVGGTSVTVPRTCTQFHNLRPWSATPNPTDADTTPVGAGTRVKWRYVTNTDAADGSGRYVMVNLPSLSPGDGNWVFLRRACFDSLPYETGAVN